MNLNDAQNTWGGNEDGERDEPSRWYTVLTVANSGSGSGSIYFQAPTAIYN